MYTVDDREIVKYNINSFAEKSKELMSMLRYSHNSYADEIRAEISARKEEYESGQYKTWYSWKVYDRFSMFAIQDSLRLKYSWAIPSDGAIKAIAKLSPIIEIGAGSGYWAKLISDAGAKIEAFDHKPKQYLIQGKDRGNWTNQNYFPIKYGTPKTLIGRSKEETLFLCWPVYDKPVAYNCLRNFTGNKFVYVGEGGGGCTGCDKFHSLLNKKWHAIAHYEIPVWYGKHDMVIIYER